MNNHQLSASYGVKTDLDRKLEKVLALYVDQKVMEMFGRQLPSEEQLTKLLDDASEEMINRLYRRINHFSKSTNLPEFLPEKSVYLWIQENR